MLSADAPQLLHDIVRRETAGSTTPSPTSTIEMPEPPKEYPASVERVGRQRVSAEREIKVESQTHEAELLNFLARGDEGQYNHLPQSKSPPGKEDLRLPRILGLNGTMGAGMGGHGHSGAGMGGHGNGFSSVRGTGILS